MKKMLVAVSFILLLLIQNVMAGSIAINPASLRDNTMVRGGYAEKFVRVSTRDENAVVTIYYGNQSSILNDWITLDPPEMVFNLSNTVPRRIKISVEPPEDTPNGKYQTSLIFSVRNQGSFEGMTGALIDTAVAFQISVTISDEEILACAVRSASLPSVEENMPWTSQFSILNSGNVRLYPTVLMEFWDQEKSELVKTIEFNDVEILPSVTESFDVVEEDLDLDSGQYFVDVKVPDCYYEETKSLDVLKQGEISAEGTLIGILVPAWNNKSDTIPIKPIFRNIGQKPVDAKFKGTISLDGSIKEIVETETIEVDAGQQIEFESFFSSDVPGRYEVSGRVYYGNKRTFEKANRFNILDQFSPERRNSGDFNYAFSFIGLGIVSLTLMILIKKKRMKRK
jgi:hypothetical protein